MNYACFIIFHSFWNRYRNSYQYLISRRTKIVHSLILFHSVYVHMQYLLCVLSLHLHCHPALFHGWLVDCYWWQWQCSCLLLLCNDTYRLSKCFAFRIIIKKKKLESDPFFSYQHSLRQWKNWNMLVWLSIWKKERNPSICIKTNAKSISKFTKSNKFWNCVC